MRQYIIFFILAILAVCLLRSRISTPVELDEVERQFADFKIKFSKDYSPEEETYRFKIFR